MFGSSLIHKIILVQKNILRKTHMC